jgi:hypothetical protein
MVQGGGVPSGHIAGPALVGTGESALLVSPIVVHPAIKQPISMSGLNRLRNGPIWSQVAIFIFA